MNTILLILLVMWALGLIGGYTFGGILHALLVIALILFIVGHIRGRRVV